MFHRLRSISGVGKILALTILYEVHDVTRFETVQQLLAAARKRGNLAVRGAGVSAGGREERGAWWL
jgi:transposase